MTCSGSTRRRRSCCTRAGERLIARFADPERTVLFMPNPALEVRELGRPQNTSAAAAERFFAELVEQIDLPRDKRELADEVWHDSLNEVEDQLLDELVAELADFTSSR